tara:strand:- start:1250 stop:1663 length:414 start_codon:yes stop_codon:yes gene_type:complete
LNDNISDKDKKDWDAFLASNGKLKDKDQREFKKNSLEIKSLDLHGYTLEEANKKVEEFINNSYLNNIKKLIIVTGKGLHSKNYENPYVSKDLSMLKYSVPEYIKKNKNLMKKIIELKEANIKDGGSGSFYIYLKNQR